MAAALGCDSDDRGLIVASGAALMSCNGSPLFGGLIGGNISAVIEQTELGPGDDDNTTSALVRPITTSTENGFDHSARQTKWVAPVAAPAMEATLAMDAAQLKLHVKRSLAGKCYMRRAPSASYLGVWLTPEGAPSLCSSRLSVRPSVCLSVCLFVCRPRVRKLLRRPVFGGQ